MVMPNKSITLSKSLIGIGSVILEYINKEEMSIDKLYDKVSKENDIEFKQFAMACAFLYSVNIIRTDEDNILITVDKNKSDTNILSVFENSIFDKGILRFTT